MTGNDCSGKIVPGVPLPDLSEEPIRVIASFFCKTAIYVAACALAIVAALAPSAGQSTEPARSVAVPGTVQGQVRDSSGRPVANAVVFLETATGPHADASIFTHTDSEGKYSFALTREGTFTVRAEMNGFGQAIFGPVVLARNETKTIDLALGSPALGSPKISEKIAEKPGAPAPEFYDEPQFTVAGVTQASNFGGHGSDTVLRTTEALAKATVSLSKESEHAPAATENSLRDAVARNPSDAALHHQLGEFEEKLGHPLEAVREYQRAAELDPSEPYLFDWGTELLTHRALQPSAEVFTKGSRLFPKSVRILIALGVAEYACGSYDRAAQYLGSASDLDPGNETPYLFMGKMQSAETAPSQKTLEQLARFQHLKPGNALANYYYAVSLAKHEQSAGALDDATSAQVEALLQKAIQIDPKLGAAHLQLGIFYAQRGDYAHAILAYRKAIDASPELEEPHYRLAQAYRRTGNEADAQRELQLHEQLSKEAKEAAQRKRNEIQQFVISLRGDRAP
jgi:tetratricopeptide (TPR) repeat protein